MGFLIYYGYSFNSFDKLSFNRHTTQRDIHRLARVFTTGIIPTLISECPGRAAVAVCDATDA